MCDWTCSKHTSSMCVSIYAQSSNTFLVSIKLSDPMNVIKNTHTTHTVGQKGFSSLNHESDFMVNRR